MNKDKKEQGGKPKISSRSWIFWLVMIGLIVLLVQLTGQQAWKEEEIGELDLRQFILNGQIEDMTMVKDQVRLTLKEEGPASGSRHKIIKGLNTEAMEAMRTFAVENDVNVRYKDQPEWLLGLIAYILPMVLLVGVLYFLFIRQMRAAGADGGILAFGRSRARLHEGSKTKVTFEDVAGVDEAREEVEEIVEFLKNPQHFSRLGGRIPRGILLVGEPGTGKTLLAKAIAGEANVPFFSISGSDFVEMFVGVGASRVRDLFRQAKESAPSLIFLDEIDAVGRRRGQGWGGGHDEREQTLNAILVEMDGCETDTSIITIAATNRPDVLDPALLRPGRFDREIVLDLPDVNGREAILKIHARRVTLSPEVDLKIMARGTPMFSGADLEAVVNEAALLATLKSKDAVEMEDLEEARDKIKFGRKKTSRVMAEEDRLVTAYHEAGHTLLAKLLPEVEPLHKVTIIPRGMSLGSTMQLPERDRYMMQRRNALGNVMMLLAGRICEEKFCGDVSSGAANDIGRATALVRKMIREWGMSDSIGLISYNDSEERMFGGEILLERTYSEATAIKIDNEIKRIIDECYHKAMDIVEKNSDSVERIAQALLKYETLDVSDVDALIEGREIEKAVPVKSGGKKAQSLEGADAKKEDVEAPQGKLSPDLGTA